MDTYLKPFPTCRCLTVYNHSSCNTIAMNFYFQAAGVLDRLGEKRGSVKGLIAALPEKDRKRTAALVIETLKCALPVA